MPLIIHFIDIPAVIDQAFITKLLNAVEINDPYEFSIKCVSDDEIKALNNTYRSKDKPTNVLSFPNNPDEDEPLGDGELRYIGDIAISLDTIEREAAEQNKAITDHFAHMTLHGYLHLLGYDHETDVEAAEMEALEIAILAKFNIKNPYE